MEQLEELLTPEDVANWLKITKQKVYQMKANKEIPFIKVGGSVRFKKSDLEKWINTKAVTNE